MSPKSGGMHALIVNIFLTLACPSICIYSRHLYRVALGLGVAYSEVFVYLLKHSFTKDEISTHKFNHWFFLMRLLGILACIELVIISLAPSVNINLRLAYTIYIVKVKLTLFLSLI